MAQKPSLGLLFLRETHWLEKYPELNVLTEVPQDPEYHPEGDVWIHTCHVVDEAAAICQREGLTGVRRVVLLFASLCHDFGKPESTVIEATRIRSPGHAQAGLVPTERFLTRIGAPQSLIDSVLPLVSEHLIHLNRATSKSVRRLAVRLSPATVDDLLLLIEADIGGRPPKPKGLTANALKIRQLAAEMGVCQDGPQPLLRGRDLIEWGMQPGREMGLALKQLYEMQLDGMIVNRDQARTWLQREGWLD